MKVFSSYFNVFFFYLNISKMLYVCRKKISFYIFVVSLMIFLLYTLHPDMNALGSYEYIARDDILDNLHEEISANLTSSAVIECDYRDILDDDTTLSITLVDGDLIEGHRIREGGEYAPQDCKPKFSTAIIVPYRDRPEQLRSFLVYMHTFFRRQKIHYRIYVIEQVDMGPFNQAKLLNIGALAAMKAGYPCLILHDIDLLPLRPANLYACTKQPRHMSASINKFRFVLPYLNLFAGVIAISSKQFKTVNGMSNKYNGGVNKGDDLYSRLGAYNMKVVRFEPATSRYHMFNSKTEIRGEQIIRSLRDVKSKMRSDGLSTLKYEEVATVLHPLFTHIMVDLQHIM